MMPEKQPLSISKFYRPALACVFLVGIGFRVFHLFIVGFKVPYNLGGLFYQMSLEIIRNRFALPFDIPYYFPGGLPFAYPPLPFYIQAVIIQWFSPPDFITVNLLPPVFSVLSLAAFYLLAKKVFSDRWLVLTAVFTFAVIPLAVSEQIEAMGLAESLGTLAIILYLHALLWAQDRPRWYAGLYPGAMLGLCALSSPGSLYAGLLISVLFVGIALFRLIRSRETSLLRLVLIVGITGLAVSAPYWLTVISNHGIGIFLKAFSGQQSALFDTLIQSFAGLRLLWSSPFWNVLFLVCLAAVLLEKRILLAVFSLVLLFVVREEWVMCIPASLVIAQGLGFINRRLGKLPRINTNLLRVAVMWLLILFFVYISAFSLLFTINEDTYDITRTQVEDLIAIQKEDLIPAHELVFVIGNFGLIEWTPALIQRSVINNPYGLEWVPAHYEVIQKLADETAAGMTPEELLSALNLYFPEIQSLYIVTSKLQLDELEDVLSTQGIHFESIQTYRELGIGKLLPGD